MTMKATIEHRKLQGLCIRCSAAAAPGYWQCVACLNKYRTSLLLPDGTPDHEAYVRIRDVYAARVVPGTADDPPHLIAHCGTWWSLVAVPWSCPSCQWTLAMQDLPMAP